MNLISISQRFVRRIKLYLSFKKVYCASFRMTSSWKTEAGLTALLCSGMGLMVIVACMQLRDVFIDTDTYVSDALSKNVQPPPLLSTSNLPAKQVLLENTIEEKNTDTLFQLDKQEELPALLPEQHTQTEKPNHAAKLPVRHTRLLLLQIQRPSASQTLMIDTISNAHQHLQSGRLSLARQAFLIALAQDTHSVEAMEGMLLVSRQLGDSQSEQEYLERLRQAIPDYDFGIGLGNDASSAGDQG